MIPSCRHANICSVEVMAYPTYLRERAHEIRIKNELTLDELAERLALPKTTVWQWIKDLPLTRPRSTEGQKRGTEAMQAKYRRLREDAYQAGLDEYALAAETTFRDFGFSASPRAASAAGTRCRSATRTRASLRLGCTGCRRSQGRRRRSAFSITWTRIPTSCKRSGAVYWGSSRPTFGASQDEHSQLRTRTWRCEHGVAAADVHDTLFRARVAAWRDCVRGGWKLDSAA